MPKNLPPPPLYSPRMWPTWALAGIGWLIARLPVRTILNLGRLLGRAAYRVGGHRLSVTRTNLALCMPELDLEAREALAREVFVQVSVGVLETVMVWLNPNRSYEGRFTVTGLDHLKRAQAKGRGVLLLGAHFAAFDVIAPELGRHLDMDVMYRHNKNPVLDRITLRGRQRHLGASIDRRDTRSALRALKAGRTLWYAPDQDYGPKVSVFAPFFGVPAATITATARFARFNDSPVLLMSHFRDLDRGRWCIHFNPPLADFPTRDPVADATRINQLIEAAIRTHPAQYLWLHRRFKTRPPGERPVYR